MPGTVERLKLRVFISSVQKELASERLALQILLTTDPFLQQHTVPILFERETHSLRPDPQQYLTTLRSCQIYVLILAKQYGSKYGDLSATHHEYRDAQFRSMPTLVSVFGERNTEREHELNAFIAEMEADNHTYCRFHSIKDLQNTVRDRLIKHIKDNYHIEPTTDEDSLGKNSLGVASAFERQRLPGVSANLLSRDLCRDLVAAADEIEADDLGDEAIDDGLRNRGYVWDGDEVLLATAAGVVTLGGDPTLEFPHCRVQADAFSGTTRNSKAADHATIKGAIPDIIDKVCSFIDRNIRHPLRVVGLQRVEFAEYPEEAIREAIVNALAHRDYEDASRHVIVEVFADRIVLSSPGPPPGDQSIEQIQSGHARPRSRNPLISQGLRFLKRMEERGTGILRMRTVMVDYGLDSPTLAIEDDYFVVTLPGAGSDLDRLQPPATLGSGLPRSVDEKLTDRERAILKRAVANGSVTSGWVMEEMGVARHTALTNLNHLIEYGLLAKTGVGRGTTYVPATSGEASK